MNQDPAHPGTPGAPPTHYEASVRRDLEHLGTVISRMALLAERALWDALKALRERNRPLAYAVILRDQAIDALEKELDRLCLEFLVRQQPAGTPLRRAYTALKISTELERVGDYAESIAHQAAKLASLDVPLPLERFTAIADIAVPMLREAIRAYLAADAELARRLIPTEDTVDLLKAELRRDLVRLYKENQLPFEALDPCLLITRRLERVSDQARNICDETLYLCTGEFAKHPHAGVYRILFLDRFHAGASLLAEAAAAPWQGPRFHFTSAGLEPRPVPEPVRAFLREKGLDPDRCAPRALTQVPELDRYHVVVALDPEVRRLFPALPRKLVFLDWPVTDPAVVTGPPEAVRAACVQADRTIEEHLRALVEALQAETGEEA
jgi:phosphate transport system protein